MPHEFTGGSVTPGPYDYESMKQLTTCMSCPGTCSCDLGSRSNFDQMSMMHWQQGKPWPFLARQGPGPAPTPAPCPKCGKYHS